MSSTTRPRYSRHASGVAALLIGVLAAGCQGQSDTIILFGSDNGRAVLAAVGDRIELRLGVVGPFDYGAPTISSSSIRLIRQWDEFGDPPPPGGAKTQRYLFEAVAAGSADITILRSLPVGDAYVFRVTVQVY